MKKILTAIFHNGENKSKKKKGRVATLISNSVANYFCLQKSVSR